MQKETIYACVYNSNGCRGTFFTPNQLSDHQAICPYKEPKPARAQSNTRLPRHNQPTGNASSYGGAQSFGSTVNRASSTHPSAKPLPQIERKKEFQRSFLVKEFGIENKHNHLNCFLNVCLQSLWQFQWVRFQIQQLVGEGPQDKGSPTLHPFIASLKQFYNEILNTSSQIDCPVTVYPSLNVRTELFKLFYEKDEFALHSKADAFEALDQILGILHGWSASKNVALKNLQPFDCIKSDCPNRECFIHQSFHQSLHLQEQCKCGELGEVQTLDQNLFATSLNTIEILETLKSIKAPNISNTLYKPESQKIFAVHQKLIEAMYLKMNESKPQCSDPEMAKIRNSRVRHESTATQMIMNAPEVFVMNLQWNGEPTPLEILRMLVSVPETFMLSDLFTCDQNEKYIFRGMICYQAAHYLAFFRRAVMKLDYLIDNPAKQTILIDKMTKELIAGEWTLFDDAVIETKGTWQSVIDQCVDFSCYPTVFFFEKVDPNDPKQNVKSTHQLSAAQVSQLFTKSQQAAQNNDYGAGFSQAEIWEQLQIQQQFSKRKTNQEVKEKVKKPELDTAALRAIKKKYSQYGIYLYKCNSCNDGIHSLHLPKCLKPGCGSKNYFQQKLPYDEVMWRKCSQEIIVSMEWHKLAKQNQEALIAQITATGTTQPTPQITTDQNEHIPVKQEAVSKDIDIGHRSPTKIITQNLDYNESPAYPNLETPRERKEQREIERLHMNLNGDVITPLPPIDQLVYPQYLPPNNHELNHQGLNNQDQVSSEGFSSFMPKNGPKDIRASGISPQLNIVAQQHPSFKTDLVNNLKKQKVNSNGLSNAERNPVQISESGKIVRDNLIQISSPKDIVGDVVSDNKKPLKGKLKQDKDSQIQPKSQADDVADIIFVEENEISINQSVLNNSQVQHQQHLPNNKHKMEEMKQMSKQVASFIAQEDDVEEEKEEKISVWKCPKCLVLMQLNEKCVKCHVSMQHLVDYRDIPFDQLLVEASLADLVSSQLNARNPNSEYLNKVQNALENKVDPIKQILQQPDKNSEQTVTVWKCPICKLCMEMSEEKCNQCDKQIQYFENIKGYSLEELILEVKISWKCPRDLTIQDKNQKCQKCGKDFIQNTKIYGKQNIPVVYSNIEQQVRQPDQNQIQLKGQSEQVPAKKNSDQLWECSKCEQLIDEGKQCDHCKISEKQSLELVQQKLNPKSFGHKQPLPLEIQKDQPQSFQQLNSKSPNNQLQIQPQKPNAQVSNLHDQSLITKQQINFVRTWSCKKCNSENKVYDEGSSQECLVCIQQSIQEQKVQKVQESQHVQAMVNQKLVQQDIIKSNQEKYWKCSCRYANDRSLIAQNCLMCNKSKAEFDLGSVKLVVELQKNQKGDISKCSECHQPHFVKAGQTLCNNCLQKNIELNERVMICPKCQIERLSDKSADMCKKCQSKQEQQQQTCKKCQKYTQFKSGQEMCEACLKKLEDELKPSKCFQCKTIFCQPGQSICQFCSDTSQKLKNDLQKAKLYLCDQCQRFNRHFGEQMCKECSSISQCCQYCTTKTTRSFDDKPICDSCWFSRLRICGNCNQKTRITQEKLCRLCLDIEQQNSQKSIQLKNCPTCLKVKRISGEPECYDCSTKKVLNNICQLCNKNHILAADQAYCAHCKVVKANQQLQKKFQCIKCYRTLKSENEDCIFCAKKYDCEGCHRVQVLSEGGYCSNCYPLILEYQFNKPKQKPQSAKPKQFKEPTISDVLISCPKCGLTAKKFYYENGYYRHKFQGQSNFAQCKLNFDPTQKQK